LYAASLAICAIGGSVADAQGVWVAKASMPTPEAAASAAGVGGKLHVFGLDGSHQVYTPTTNGWTTAAANPAPAGAARAGTVNGVVYLIGGCVNSDCRVGVTGATQAYDPASDSWTTKASMPTGRYGFGLAVSGDLLYAVGGSGACPPCTPLSTVEVYDTKTDAWTTKSSMPAPRAQLGAGFANGQLYAIGGVDGSGQVVSTVEVYSPSKNSWKSAASLPTPQALNGVTALNGNIYSVSGQTTGNVATNAVYVFDALTDTWLTESPIPTERYGSEPVTIGPHIFVAGDGEGNSAINTLDRFSQ
jgi:N-acetylneuraminic acid mutarotase